MTNEHRPLEAAEANRPVDQAQSHEAPSPSDYFSDTTLALIGQEHAEAVLAKRIYIDDTLTAADREQQALVNSIMPHIT
ncbi:MAG TPA: hypothetical protein VF733_05850, partial [Candidatus Saccharimonadales bacterium]